MLMITCYLHIHDHFRHQPFDLSFQKESIHGSASGSDSFYGNEQSNVISLSGVSVTVFAPPWVVVAMCVFVNAHLTYVILPTLYK